MGRRGYPAEFRRRALDLVAAGKTVAEVARLLEVSDQSIYSWRRQEQIDRGELPGLSSAEREELRTARVRIRALETELAVHRRAAELLKESVRPKSGSRRSPWARRFLRQLRRSPGPRRARARPRDPGRPQRGRDADAARRAWRRLRISSTVPSGANSRISSG
jgi:transposase